MSQNPIIKNNQVYSDRYGHNENVRNRRESEDQGVHLDGSGEDYETGLDSDGPSQNREGFEPPERGRDNRNPDNDDALLDDMDEESLVRTGRELADVQADEEDENRPFRTIVGDLKREIERSDLDPEDKSRLLREASRLLRGGNRITPEALNKLEDLRESFQNALTALEGEHEAQNQQFASSSTDLMGEISSSSLSETKKSEFTEGVTEIKNRLRREQLTPQQASEELATLKTNFRRTVQTEEMKASLDHFPNRVPTKGWRWEKTQELAVIFKRAVQSNDWSEMRTWMRANDTGERAIDNIIIQFVGTLYFNICDEDEGKLNQILDLIPTDLRGEMVDYALADVTNINENVDSETHRAEFAYYGTPTGTADRLRDSIRWSETPEEERSGSSPTRRTTTTTGGSGSSNTERGTPTGS